MNISPNVAETEISRIFLGKYFESLGIIIPRFAWLGIQNRTNLIEEYSKSSISDRPSSPVLKSLQSQILNQKKFRENNGTGETIKTGRTMGHVLAYPIELNYPADS